MRITSIDVGAGTDGSKHQYKSTFYSYIESVVKRDEDRIFAFQRLAIATGDTELLSPVELISEKLPSHRLFTSQSDTGSIVKNGNCFFIPEVYTVLNSGQGKLLQKRHQNPSSQQLEQDPTPLDYASASNIHWVTINGGVKGKTITLFNLRGLHSAFWNKDMRVEKSAHFDALARYLHPFVSTCQSFLVCGNMYLSSRLGVLSDRNIHLVEADNKDGIMFFLRHSEWEISVGKPVVEVADTPPTYVHLRPTC